MVPVKVKKLHADAVIPQYARDMDAGFDLVAVEGVVVRPGETVKVPIGLAFALPEGFELQVRNRSGIASKTKLRVANSPGTVDAGYRGEVSVIIDNITQPHQNLFPNDDLLVDGKTLVNGALGHPIKHWTDGAPFYGSYRIKKGDRIAQGVLATVPIAQFEVVDELDETERGDGGFGSSGTST